MQALQSGPSLSASLKHGSVWQAAKLGDLRCGERRRRPECRQEKAVCRQKKIPKWLLLLPPPPPPAELPPGEPWLAAIQTDIGVRRHRCRAASAARGRACAEPQARKASVPARR